MPDPLPREVAARSGVDVAYVARLIEAGVLRREGADWNVAGAVRLVRMVHSLEQSGIPLSDMAEAIRTGRLSFAFLDLPVFDRFSGLAGVTFRELSVETGIPLDLLQTVREVIGFSLPGPDEHVRDDELLIVPVIEQHLKGGLKPAVIERWLRVYGDSLRRMAETEADWWRTEIEAPLVASGVGEGVVLDRAAQWGARMAPLQDQAVLAIYHAHEEHAWLNNIIGNVEHALEQAGLHASLGRPPAICFLDMTGYSRLTEERGDDAAADHAARLAHVVQRTAVRHGGKVVKWLGDGVMFYFRDARPATLAATEMMEAVAQAKLPPAHVGLHAGPVVFQQGDYFGRTVNIAARISDYARPGEVLISGEMLGATDLAEIDLTRLGEVTLKGVVGAVDLYSVRRREGPGVTR